MKDPEEQEFKRKIDSLLKKSGIDSERKSTISKINSYKILLSSGRKAFDYFVKNADLESEKTFIISTATPIHYIFNPSEFNTVINLMKVNNIRFINKFFESVNEKLNNGDLFIGCFETYRARNNRLRVGKIPIVKSFYFAFEFILMRVFPKLPVLKKIYFYVTKGKGRLLSKAEVLGRLVCCGFEISDFRAIEGLTYFVARKVKEPTFDMHPSYGFLYKVPRIGKNGKIIGVYKLRTMHPYSEYLHEYILSKNGYAESGKPADDFRLTPWGLVMRRYWLDELPQLINVLKGELKLVGIRPVGKIYFKEIPEDLQALRLKHKPGCIPPYVALNRKSDVKSVLQAEREYLIEKSKHPYTTDIKYLKAALFNIIFKKKRSA